MLQEAGFAFTQADPPFADPLQPDDATRHRIAELVVRLARRKARSVLETLALGDRDPVIVLGADTLGMRPDGRPAGQPADRDEVRRMIQQFVGRSHDVFTGVALLSTDRRDAITFADAAGVTFGQVRPDQLDAYLDTDQWRGKAGGYNLLDRQADGWPIRVGPDSDPTTVVGLPMRKLIAALDRLSVRPTHPCDAPQA